jgi:hypothetical protein
VGSAQVYNRPTEHSKTLELRWYRHSIVLIGEGLFNFTSRCFWKLYRLGVLSFQRLERCGFVVVSALMVTSQKIHDTVVGLVISAGEANDRT